MKNSNTNLHKSTGAFSFAESSLNNNTPCKKINVVEKVPQVASNDYTKNISELVFTPALSKRPQTTIGGRVVSGKAIQRVKGDHKISEKKYKEIENQLKNEKEHRDKLTQEIK
jgi:hypothetical protein